MRRPIRLAWDGPAPGNLMESLMSPSTIYGYRTNEDGTETPSWRVDDAGRVHCDHLDEGCCGDCVAADERLVRRRGTVVAVRPGARSHSSRGERGTGNLGERVAAAIEEECRHGLGMAAGWFPGSPACAACADAARIARRFSA